MTAMSYNSFSGKFEDYDKDREQLVNKYKAHSLGPKKELALEEFIQTHRAEREHLLSTNQV